MAPTKEIFKFCPPMNQRIAADEMIFVQRVQPNAVANKFTAFRGSNNFNNLSRRKNWCFQATRNSNTTRLRF